jgi:hypothetical protein
MEAVRLAAVGNLCEMLNAQRRTRFELGGDLQRRFQTSLAVFFSQDASYRVCHSPLRVLLS